MTVGRRWTAEEEVFVRDWLSDPKNLAPRFQERLAALLDRSPVAVAVRISRLGLGDYTRKVPEQFRAPPRKPKHATAEARKAAIVEATRKRFAENGHPRGYLGHKHSDETRQKLSARVKAAWNDPNSRFHETSFKQARADSLSRVAAARITSGSSNPYSRALRGKREDLGETFFRSRWEANYARYLNALLAGGTITGWEYEPQTFWFEAIRRGVRSYTPDFRVDMWDGTHEWHEVKGWLDAKSKTKLKRMKKYHPKEKVIVIDERFFRQCERTGFAGTIPFWEYKRAR